MENSDVVVEFSLTGDCMVDTGLVIGRWDHTWFLSQYKDQYTLCQREGGQEKPALKVQVSGETAAELVERLNLVQTKSTFFTHASSWRRPGEYDGY